VFISTIPERVPEPRPTDHFGTIIELVARTSRNETIVTVHPHDVDLSQNLPNPDATSFFYIECLHRDD